MAGAPDIKAFKIAVRTGLFKNCPITESDVALADQIYGPSASVLKGKTKRSTPKAVIDDWIEIPPEITDNNLKINLHINIVFINNTFGLTAIDDSVRYRQYVPLRSRIANSLYDAIDVILREYNHAQFTIKTI